MDLIRQKVFLIEDLKFKVLIDNVLVMPLYFIFPNSPVPGHLHPLSLAQAQSSLAFYYL